MNPQWPYSQFPIPPPNFAGTIPPQPLQQNSWAPVNPPSAALSISSQVPASSNIMPLNAALSSIPPPQMMKPVPSSLVVQPSYQFNVPPPGIFPTSIPPPNLFSQSILPSIPPPIPVSAVSELQAVNSVISPTFQAPPPQASYVTYPIQTASNSVQNAVSHSSCIAQSSDKLEEKPDKSFASTSVKDSLTIAEKAKKARDIYKNITSSMKHDSKKLTSMKRDSKKLTSKEDKTRKDSFKKSSSPDRKSNKIESDAKIPKDDDIKDEPKNEKPNIKTDDKVKHKVPKEIKRERSSSSHSRSDRRRQENSSYSSRHSKKTESSEKRKRDHHCDEKEQKEVKKIKRERESPKRHHVRRRRSSPEDLPCLSYKAYKYVHSSAAEKYYCPPKEDSKEIVGKDSLVSLHKRFKYELVDRAERCRAFKPKYDPPVRKTILRKPKPPKSDSDDESSSSSDKTSSDEEDTAMEELERKKKHPDRLHLELWFNDPKEMNDGPLCRCSAKARRAGIRHGIYVGEDHLPLCDPFSNNADRLFHYRITITPHTNFLTNNPTTIHHKGHNYRFEGFSLFSHSPLPRLPNCKVIRFNYEYTILYTEEEFPKNFTVGGLELFTHYLLFEILELVDINWKAHDDPDGCPRFHIMPRFSRELKDGGKELLAHSYVLDFLLKENKILVNEEELSNVLTLPGEEWQDLADDVKGMIVTCPGMKPSSIRVDQLDREQCSPNKEEFPVIVHFGVRPPQLSYAGNPLYQKAWRDYVKFRHLLANKPKVKYLDRHKLIQKEDRLQAMRMENDLKRDVTVVVSSKNFYKTGIMSDIVQHAMLLPVLICHLRFHQSLSHLEDKLSYQFKDRYLLQLALTHPSYRENFGTNPDHARNSLTNCGLRQPQYGDRRIHYMNTRKRGINTLINIMSRFGSQKESVSSINHNERLEFLGDAVVEFLSSIHLFYMFPDLEEGGLATYRAAIVQNQHLAVLSRKLELDRFMLYAHGSDLCHDLELRHAMANCFEALMGALFLDNGIEVADKVFSQTLFSEQELLEVWKNFPPHPLQEQEPDGDRKWIEHVPLLQRLHEFEETIGIEFNHIRLLARALTHRSLGYNNLTLGSNQRLEFLGDTVLQLVASEYLYKFFPDHHEGHLSLLRSSLVNNRTQAVVCADLGMVDYAIYPYEKVELKPKDKADLLEAFLGALYVDKDLGYCKKFCEVCFFPRLQDFIMNQDWNDPKSKLQQCCLTLRSMDGGEPDIPTYKVIECKGPTNTRVYSVAVYFQSNRLAVGSGHSIQQAEMDAADNALRKSKDLFPQLRHQRRAIERSLKQGPPKKRKNSPSKWRDSPLKHRRSLSKQKDSAKVQKDSSKKQKDSSKKLRNLLEKTKETSKRKKDSSHKHRNSPEKIKESSKKQKDSSKKHRNSPERNIESSKKPERFLDESVRFSSHCLLGRAIDSPENHKDTYKKHKRSRGKLPDTADKQQDLAENTKDLSDVITDSFEKPRDVFMDQRDSFQKPRDVFMDHRDSSDKIRDSPEKFRDSVDKFRGSSERLTDSLERHRSSSKKPRDSPEKHREASKKHKDPSTKHSSKKHKSSLKKHRDSPKKPREHSKKHKSSPKKHKDSSKKIRDSTKHKESSKSQNSKIKHSNLPRGFT